MKLHLPILGLIGVALSCCTPGFAGSPDVSASELATHLGISVWRISADNLPPVYTAWVEIVQDGKVTKDYTARMQFHRKGDLLVMAHNTPQGVAISLDSGDLRTFRPHDALEVVSWSVGHSLPKDAGVGTYILCGDYPLKNGKRTATGRIEDLDSGLVLKIVQ